MRLDEINEFDSARLSDPRRKSLRFRDRQFTQKFPPYKETCAKPERRNQCRTKILVYDFRRFKQPHHNMSLLLNSRRLSNSISSLAICYRCQQIRNATLLRRPKRPYTF